MTPESIIDGAVEYMPNKTKGERPEVIRVQLNKRALGLVEKYNIRVSTRKVDCSPLSVRKSTTMQSKAFLRPVE